MTGIGELGAALQSYHTPQQQETESTCSDGMLAPTARMAWWYKDDFYMFFPATAKQKREKLIAAL